MVLWYGRLCKKRVERCCELANKTTQQLYKISTPCIDDHHFKEEEMKSVGELSQVCSQIDLKCWYLARIGRHDILWSVNTCAIDHKMDQSLWQTIISFDILHSSYMWIQTVLSCGKHFKQCRLGLFQDSDFAGDLEDSKSTSAGTLCISGSHTFVPTIWMCKKQTSVSHSSTESEIIGRDSCSRFMGSDCFCPWKHDSDSWQIGATRCQRWQRSQIKHTISRNDQSVE